MEAHEVHEKSSIFCDFKWAIMERPRDWRLVFLSVFLSKQIDTQFNSGEKSMSMPIRVVFKYLTVDKVIILFNFLCFQSLPLRRNV